MTESQTNCADDENGNDEDKNEEAKSYPPTILGWIVRFVSLALLALLSAIVLSNVFGEKDPIVFKTEVISEDIRKEAGRWLIPIEITNEGSEPASLVKIDLSAGAQTETVEIPLIGAKETVRYVLNMDEPVTSVSPKIVSYESS